MIAPWMVYSLLASALVSLAALALENALRLRGAPLRWVWVGALLGSLALAAAPWTRVGSAPASEGDSRGAAVARGSLAREGGATARVAEAAGPPAARSAARALWPRATRADLGWMDAPLVLLWALLSGAGAVRLAGAGRSLRRRRGKWRWTKVDGVLALVTKNTGPAVVGFRGGVILLPRWVVEMDERERRLVVAHEEEHLRAGDSRLLALSLVALALMPWNAPLWWQARRLRHAIELDCDARVLSRGGDPRSYGALLIEVGRRASGHAAAIAAFSESSTVLERRIRAMGKRKPRGWRAFASASAATAVLLFLLACELPLPTMVRPAQAVTPGSLARSGLRAGAVPEASDSLVFYLADGVIRLRIRTPDEEEPAGAICSDPLGPHGEGVVGLIWPGCGGYKLYGDGSVTLSKVHVVVGEVVAGGPVWKAGLRSGDVLLSVDGHDTRTILRPFSGNRPPGAPAVPYRVRVRRGAEELDLELPVF